MRYLLILFFLLSGTSFSQQANSVEASLYVTSPNTILVRTLGIPGPQILRPAWPEFEFNIALFTVFPGTYFEIWTNPGAFCQGCYVSQGGIVDLNVPYAFRIYNGITFFIAGNNYGLFSTRFVTGPNVPIDLTMQGWAFDPNSAAGYTTTMATYVLR